MNIDVNGQKQSPRAGEVSPAEPPAVLSEPLTVTISDLLAASEQAAHAMAAVAHSREQLPQLETSVSQLTELLKELRADVDRLRAEVTPVGEDQPSRPPAHSRPQFDQRALLIALNMASNGAPRSEAADYLAEHLGLRDCDELLGAVYSYVASTRTGPRETNAGRGINDGSPRD